MFSVTAGGTHVLHCTGAYRIARIYGVGEAKAPSTRQCIGPGPDRDLKRRAARATCPVVDFSLLHQECAHGYAPLSRSHGQLETEGTSATMCGWAVGTVHAEDMAVLPPGVTESCAWCHRCTSRVAV